MKLGEGIHTIPDFLSAEECARFIEISEKIGFEKATITTPEGSSLRPDVRNNARVIWESAAVASDLWQKAAPQIPIFLGGRQVIGFNERFRFYRYDEGQQFSGHVDAPYRRANGEQSQLTFMIYLNDDFEGGETRFDDVIVVPKTGTGLLFQHELFHEGAPVRRGRKYVLRTDVMYNPVGKIKSTI